MVSFIHSQTYSLLFCSLSFKIKVIETKMFQCYISLLFMRFHFVIPSVSQSVTGVTLLTHQSMGRGAVRPPPLGFFPLLKKSSGNPYLKILDFFQLYVADAHMKKKKVFLHPVFILSFCFSVCIFVCKIINICLF